MLLLLKNLFGNVPAIANTKDCFHVTTLHTSQDAVQFNAT